MLFLAVTLGFFVENQREHYIENLRAKRYAASLIEDLKRDTAEAHINLRFNKRFLANADSVINELRKPHYLQNDTFLMTRGTNRMLLSQLFDAQMSTYEQIKNSGSLRYFKQDIINKLNYYEKRKQRLERLNGGYEAFSQQITEFMLKLTNNDFLYAWEQKLPIKEKKVFIKEPDTETRSLWLNYIINLAAKIRVFELGIANQEKNAIEIIALLRKEYHLK
jgi:hypothetical protein